MNPLKHAQDMVINLASRVEKRLGVKLENIVIKESTITGNADIDDNNLMRVNRRAPNTIYMKTSKYLKKGSLNQIMSHIELDLTHELIHLAHIRLAGHDVFWKSASPAFREGFAEYVSTHLIFDYDNDSSIINDAIKPRIACLHNSHNFSNIYVQGYTFFEKVLGVIGQDRISEVSRAPPISAVEVKYPTLYLLRNYPVGTLRSLPERISAQTDTALKEYNPLKCGMLSVPKFIRKCFS